MASCHLTVADCAQGRRPDNRPGGDDSDPGLASRRESSPTAKNEKVLSYQRGLQQHTAKGRDPRTPASHWPMRVVAATAGMLRLDGRIRPHFRARQGQLHQVLRHRRFCGFVFASTMSQCPSREVVSATASSFSEAVITWERTSSTGAALVWFQASQPRCLVCLLMTQLEDLLLRIWKCSIMKFHW